MPRLSLAELRNTRPSTLALSPVLNDRHSNTFV